MPESLRDHTTLRLGGPARDWVVAQTEAELIEAVSAADSAGEQVLILGGGSNLVIADDGFDGTVVEVATRGISADVDGPDGASCEIGAGPDDPTCGGAMVTVAAGERWDDFVAHAAARAWIGVEALSGIPGSVGATPIQNVGAYGQEVGQTIAQVRVWDRTLHGIRTFAAADCHFSYRHSRFKADPDRHVVLSVTFQLRQGTLGEPIAYAELARALGVEVGQRAPLTAVRQAVLDLRRGKGMVLDEADHDTWSAGSFFTNPFVDAEQLPEGAPAYPQADGTVKTSAAWLIEQAGYGKGYPGSGPVTLSTKHTLALTNRGDATTADLLALAREIRDGVRKKFGIELVNEPVTVGVAL
ncbi:MAG: UDP-N-acetylmuramate dehydrogenase [Nocardioides sp.]